MLKLIGQPSVEERAFALTRTGMLGVFTDGSPKRADDACSAVWRKATGGEDHIALVRGECAHGPLPGQGKI